MFFRARRRGETLRLLFKTSLLNISGWLKIEQFQRWERNWYWHSSIATRNDRWMMAKTLGLLWQYRRCSRVRKVNDEQNCSWCVWGDDDHNWNEGRPRDLGNEEKSIDRWSLHSRCQTDKNTSLFVFIGLWTFVPPTHQSWASEHLVAIIYIAPSQSVWKEFLARLSRILTTKMSLTVE